MPKKKQPDDDIIYWDNKKLDAVSRVLGGLAAMFHLMAEDDGMSMSKATRQTFREVNKANLFAMAVIHPELVKLDEKGL